MLINNVDIKKYNAKLLNKEIKSVDIDTQEMWNKQSLLPLFLSKKVKYKHIELEILISTETETDTEINISNILKEFLNDTVEIKFNGLGIIYNVMLVGNETVKTVRKEKKRLMLELIGYAYTDIVIENLDRILTKTITNTGNMDTPCVVEITPSIDIIDIKIEGLSDDPITIRNLKQGQKVIINGEDGTVLENGANKFGDTDMWEFPRLKPGANTITVSKSSTDINIKYKPRWI